LYNTPYNSSHSARRFPRVFLFARFFLLTAFVCAPGSAALWGQEAGYRIEDDGRFVQVLNWEQQENVFYYEVEIEKQAGALWEGALTGKTEESFFEFSLAPGSYRYRVRPYDFLERPAAASDWIQFAIFPARQPELAQFSPEVFYLDEGVTWILTIYGRNLAEGIEIFLRETSTGALVKPDTVTARQSMNEARLTFRFEQLVPGSYAIHAINPGGLTAETQAFGIIAFGKPVDITLSAGYRPLVPLYGQINELFGTAFFPAGVYSRLSIIPFKWLRGSLGFDIEPAWNYFLVAGDNYEVQAQMSGAVIYGMYRGWFPNRVMTYDFRIGGGMYSILDYHLAFDRGNTDPIVILVPVVAAGVSLRWLVKRPFFMEAGLDFTHLFSVDKPSPGYLRPFAGLGWQF
jgi:hypothetical protein